jgi:hypothetical protein
MTVKITKANLVEIGAVLTTVYGVLTSTAVVNHLPPYMSGILAAVGPVVVSLFAYLNHPSTGTSTMPVTTPGGQVVQAPIAPVVPTVNPPGVAS